MVDGGWMGGGGRGRGETRGIVGREATRGRTMKGAETGTTGRKGLVSLLSFYINSGQN